MTLTRETLKTIKAIKELDALLIGSFGSKHNSLSVQHYFYDVPKKSILLNKDSIVFMHMFSIGHTMIDEQLRYINWNEANNNTNFIETSLNNYCSSFDTILADKTTLTYKTFALYLDEQGNKASNLNTSKALAFLGCSRASITEEFLSSSHLNWGQGTFLLITTTIPIDNLADTLVTKLQAYISIIPEQVKLQYELGQEVYKKFTTDPEISKLEKKLVLLKAEYEKTVDQLKRTDKLVFEVKDDARHSIIFNNKNSTVDKLSKCLDPLMGDSQLVKKMSSTNVEAPEILKLVKSLKTESTGKFNLFAEDPNMIMHYGDRNVHLLSSNIVKSESPRTSRFSSRRIRGDSNNYREPDFNAFYASTESTRPNRRVELSGLPGIYGSSSATTNIGLRDPYAWSTGLVETQTSLSESDEQLLDRLAGLPDEVIREDQSPI